MAEPFHVREPSTVPEKPTVDGLEVNWTGALGGRGDLPLRPGPPPRTSTASTPRRRRSRANCTSATSSATPRATSSPGSGACAAATSFTRWAGTTTGCRPSAASRTTSGCAVTRRCPTTPTSSRRRRPAKEKVPISRRNFVELCHQLTAVDEEAFKRPLALPRGQRRLEPRVLDDLARGPGHQLSAAFLAMLERGEVYSSVAPTLWDIDFRTAVSQAELEDRERPGTYHRVAFSRSDGAGVDRDRDDPARDGRRAASRSSPTPTTRGTAALRHDGRHAALQGRGARSSPTSSPTRTRVRASP